METSNTTAAPIPRGDGDTICAPATPAGGAICVIRLSGARAIAAADSVFRPASGRPLASARANTVHYGEVVGDDGEAIDDVLATVFRAPRSYTGEDSVEISCHGSRYVVGALLALLARRGCRPARPGEYTLRAFLNGKMDLSQAEAVADLIASTSRASHRLALSQLRGHFASDLAQLRGQLLRVASLLELELDFSDHEDLEFADRREIADLAERAGRHVARLAESFRTGRAIKEGIPVAIVGRTNVGKSTLLNRLLREERALVSDVHGTTRDSIEDTADIGGVTFRFIDTAGLRETDDTVERMGIERTRRKAQEAAVVVWLTDRQPSKEEAEEMRAMAGDKPVITVRNKCDLPTAPDTRAASSAPARPDICISAKTGENVEQLEALIYRSAGIPDLRDADVVVTSARHFEALSAARESLRRVVDGLRDGLSGDLVAEDLRTAIAELGEITGCAITPEDTLNNIFKNFCVGK